MLFCSVTAVYFMCCVVFFSLQFFEINNDFPVLVLCLSSSFFGHQERFAQNVDMRAKVEHFAEPHMAQTDITAHTHTYALCQCISFTLAHPLLGSLGLSN